MSGSNTHEIVRRALLALAPLLVAAGIPGLVELWNRPDPGFTPRESTVGVVDPRGAADRAGLEAGDLLLQMNGQPVTHPAAYWAYLHPLHPGDTLELDILRGGTQGRISYVLPDIPLRLRLRDVLMTAVATTFLFLGFVTYLRRNDALGRYFYLTCVLLSYSFLPLPTFPWVVLMQVLESLRSVLQLLLPAVFLRFFLIFPEGLEDQAASARHRWWMLPPLLLAPIHVFFNFSGRINLQAVNILQILSAALLVGYLVVAFVVFLRKTRRRDRWNLWSRLRLGVMSLAAGILPLMVATLARQIWPSHGFPDQAALLLLPLAPAGFSLALLRSGAIDLAYLTRRALIAIALSLPILGLAIVLLGDLGPRGTGRDLRMLIAVGGTFVAAVLAVPMRRRVGSLIDRVFYPELNRIRSESAQLGDALSQRRKPADVANTLCAGMRSLFRAQCAVLYGMSADQFTLLATAGDGPSPPRRLPPDARLLKTTVASQEIRLVEPMLTGRRALRLDPDSRRLVDATDVVLLCPLIAAGETVAVLGLGPAESGREYGALEVYHVELLARQTAASLENAILHEEDLQRERVQVELDLAREIQSNLLPEEPLTHLGAEIHGSMIASREIGGDLFDYFEIGDGRIAMTVADAAGKGVPASLLMSGVRSAVREVLQPDVDCGTALSRLNADVFSMTGDRHFVALFLGILEPASNVLEYGVAGLEPPLWIRAALGRAERLTRGGPVLGVTSGAVFQTGIVRLHPGDSLLVFSDGMTDEEDAQGEPYTYERLLRRSLAAAKLPPGELLSRVMTEVSGFGEGTSTDDRTLLVLRVVDRPARGMEDAAALG